MSRITAFSFFFFFILGRPSLLSTIHAADTTAAATSGLKKSNWRRRSQATLLPRLAP
ncbi:hypothetical protein O6H91_Y568900 [Diphasiastrum complanatum]|nr:hypothetical protein O6H91_Y568900 [Diphasiastrum complanatum]KAJ7114140.1 hypothetical protein O6H91_Y568900 [Diphasiastrum complanatum]KAJ7114141.1 hypothetical protein O6H91_Y568900 [Diphasiastrum complanatum]KAJ7114142.1 hypothetical protein O6H91_Y568900 [Diphasiastrum complanatum]